MSCGKIRDLLSSYLDGRVSPAQRRRLEEHVASCPDCAHELALLRETVGLVKGLPELELPEGFHAKLHLGLAQAEAERIEAEARGLAGGRGAGRGFEPRAGGVFGWLRGLGRRPVLRGALVSLAALALIFSVVRSAIPGWNGSVWSLLAAREKSGELVGRNVEPAGGPTGSGLGVGAPPAVKGSDTFTVEIKGSEGGSPQTTPAQTGSVGRYAAGGTQIIFTATLEVEVKEFAPAQARVTEVAEAAGGYVEQSHFNLKGAFRTGWLRLRVPQAKYGEVLGELEELGKVLGKETGTEDVTGAVIDLEARIANLHRQELRLGELLGQAKNLDEILRVENELNRVRYEMEANQGQLKWLQDRVALATISVTISEPGANPPPVVPGADLWQRIWRAFVETWKGIGRFLDGLVVFAASVVPVVLVGGAAWWGFNRWRRSRLLRGPQA